MMNRHFIFALCAVLGFSVSGVSMAQSTPADKEAAAKAAKAAKVKFRWGKSLKSAQKQAEETGLLDNPGLGSNPDVIRLLYQASRLLDEAPLHHSGAATPSPAEEAMRMESDPSHPLYEAYMNVNHPNHRYANELYDRLTSR